MIVFASRRHMSSARVFSDTLATQLPAEHGVTCFSFGWNVKFDGENICKYFRNNFHKWAGLTIVFIFPILRRLFGPRLGPCGEREVFQPRNRERRNGAGKSGQNGAPAPQSRAASPY